MSNVVSSVRVKLPALDTLRSIAILWVIVHHMRVPFCWPIESTTLLQFLKLGFAGVDLFFVLSGFLITRIVLQEIETTGTLNLRQFWYRRWLRTLPAYYVVLITLRILDECFPSDQSWPSFYSYIVFLQNYVCDRHTMRFAWSWSLCVEEWFYIAMPIVALWLLRRRYALSPKRLLRSVAGIALIGSIAARIGLQMEFRIGQISIDDAIWQARVRGHFRLDGLAAGVFIATLPRLRFGYGACLLALGASLSIVMMILLKFHYLLQFHQSLILAVAFAAFVWLGAGENRWARCNVPGAGFIASISYSLYLVHPMVEKIVLRTLPHLEWYLQSILYLAITLVASMGLRYTVELPFLRWRDRSH